MQAESVTFEEKGTNVTVTAAINIIGNHVHPMYIFLTSHFKNHTMTCAPTSIADTNPTGWSREHFLANYRKPYITYGKPCKEDPAVMILDNHVSHLQIPTNNTAKENRIIILTLPPNKSHKLQSWKSSIFGPYEEFYNVCLNEWMFSNPTKLATIYNIGGIGLIRQMQYQNRV
jgi:hypothetical protein